MMRKIKKLGVILISTILVFQMAGCGNTGASADSGNRQTDTELSTVDKSEQDSANS